MFGIEIIDENLLDEIIKYNDESIVFSLESNKDNIKKVIDYLESIGIKNIEELLKYEIDIFLHDLRFIKKKIHPDDIDLINNINDDCTFIEEI